jgi:hypothetical protein
MKNYFNTFIILFLTSILIEGLVHALSIGTLVDKYYAEANKGSTVEFVVKVWNVEKESESVSFKVLQNDRNLPVFITPNNFILNYSGDMSGEKGAEYVNSNFGLMKVTPVRILINIPNSIKYNDYTILISVTGGKPTSGISTFLESKLRFVVKVTPYVPKPTKQIDTEGAKLSDITGLFISASKNRLIFPVMLIVIIILVISLLIYKYA